MGVASADAPISPAHNSLPSLRAIWKFTAGRAREKSVAVSPKSASAPNTPAPSAVDVNARKIVSGIRAYNYLMRVKTSITLPKELLGRLDRNRSALLERAARAYLAQLERQARDRKDIEIIDRYAERLNREAMETLEYQQLP
jgi:hypothetical protein